MIYSLASVYGQASQPLESVNIHVLPCGLTSQFLYRHKALNGVQYYVFRYELLG